MDIYQFLSSLIGSLAWPLVVIFFFYKFNEPMSKVVRSLARMKYKDFELDFGKELEGIETQSDQLPQLDLEPSIENEVIAVASISPMAAIPLAWSHLETEISKAISRLAISADYPPHNSPLKNIEILNKYECISESDYNLLNELRRLRNDISHRKIDPETITVARALDYAKIAFNLGARLQEAKYKPQESQ